MTPCREYQGARDRHGYGRRHGRSAKRWGTSLVHRQIMKMAGVDIDGKIVMHICDNPACFRFDHLRVGTQDDNLKDMASKGRAGHYWSDQTHCSSGHEFTPENTYTYTRDGIKRRSCRTCRREAAKQRYWRNKS